MVLIGQRKAARYSVTEFLDACAGGAFAGERVELVGGEARLMGVPLNSHARYQMQMCVRLAASQGEERVRGETGIALSADTIRVCDVALLTRPVADNRLLQPADLLVVVEIADTTIARDLGAKRADYARAGIPNYWVIDSERRVAHLLEQPAGEDFARERVVSFGSPLAVPGGGVIVLD